MLNFLRDLARALIKPLLVLGILILVFAMSVKPKQPLQSPEQQATALFPLAGAGPLPPPKRKAPLSPIAAKLARFHGGAQSFASEAAAIEALADALNIPKQVVANDVARALALAEANSGAMLPFTGRFPLPKATSRRLLAALAPADIPQLERHLAYALAVDKERFSLEAGMASGNLRLEARITKLAKTCLRATMTFVRRSFRHSVTAAACRRGVEWTLLDPATERKTP